MGLDMFLWADNGSDKVEVAYWRKANAVHKWFVDYVQNGVDRCEEHMVTTGELMHLVDTCKKVLADNELAESLLPTTSGFFFGSTDYDEYYFEDLQLTVDQIEEALAKHTEEGTNFFYQSSW